MGPGSDHLGSNYVIVTHNMCDFGHVTLISLCLQFPIYKFSMKIVSTV